jgi:hypothetical protein
LNRRRILKYIQLGDNLGKARRGDKERSREQELKYENQKLRKEIGSLRKQLARVDLDRHSYVRTIVEEHLAGEEISQSTESMLKSLENTWKCNKCKEGHLQIHPYSRAGETWYYRACSNQCGQRTTGKLYNPESVKGILATPTEESDRCSNRVKTFKK